DAQASVRESEDGELGTGSISNPGVSTLKPSSPFLSAGISVSMPIIYSCTVPFQFLIYATPLHLTFYPRGLPIQSKMGNSVFSNRLIQLNISPPTPVGEKEKPLKGSSSTVLEAARQHHTTVHPASVKALLSDSKGNSAIPEKGFLGTIGYMFPKRIC
ncbi:hypothetical protein AVEN_189755-1, partial [Araneus ventricosus]